MGQAQGKGKDVKEEKISKSKTLRQRNGGDVSLSRENVTEDSKDLQGYPLAFYFARHLNNVNYNGLDSLQASARFPPHLFVLITIV